MSHEEIKVGAVVKLRSGGPRMTVVSRGGDKDRYVECQWFDDKKVSGGGFIVEALALDKVDTD